MKTWVLAVGPLGVRSVSGVGRIDARAVRSVHFGLAGVRGRHDEGTTGSQAPWCGSTPRKRRAGVTHEPKRNGCCNGRERRGEPARQQRGTGTIRAKTGTRTTSGAFIFFIFVWAIRMTPCFFCLQVRRRFSIPAPRCAPVGGAPAGVRGGGRGCRDILCQPVRLRPYYDKYDVAAAMKPVVV